MTRCPGLAIHRQTAGALILQRAGVVLLVVLIVVVMLALGAYSFTQLMIVEARGAKNYGQMVQLREAADSGVPFVAALLADQKRNGVLGQDLYDNAELFRDVEVADDPIDGSPGGCRFSIVAPRDDETADDQRSVRFGLADESARLNVNGWLQVAALIGDSASRQSANTSGVSGLSTAGKNPLLLLPNMTPEIADAILDWVDPDDDVRLNGAEGEVYRSRGLTYKPRNGPMATLDELLLIRGITRPLLYGLDSNLNGIRDSNEEEHAKAQDSGDDILHRGWLPFLTVYSRETNRDRFGNARINLNSEDLQALYDKLAQDPEFGEERARFVVAYRLFGPSSAVDSAPPSNGVETTDGDSGTNTAAQPGGKKSGTGPSRGRGNSSGSKVTEQSGGGTAGSGQQVSVIAGLDASGGSKTEFESTLDLVGAAVNARNAGSSVSDRLENPFQQDDKSVDTLMDRATIWNVPSWVGRVNVNTAPREVLQALPGLTDDHVETILRARAARDGDGGQKFNGGVGWLVTEGALTIEELKKLETYITGHSQVFRVQVIGYSERRAGAMRVDAMIDLTGRTPRIRLWRDLTALGGGPNLRRLALDEGLPRAGTTRSR